MRGHVFYHNTSAVLLYPSFNFPAMTNHANISVAAHRFIIAWGNSVNKLLERSDDIAGLFCQGLR
jgi:hypothetical protein